MELVSSLLSLAAFIPVLLRITSPAGVSSAWTGVNTICVILGLLVSAVCVKNSKSRSIINMIAMVISSIWLLVMIGMIVLTVFISFLQ